MAPCFSFPFDLHIQPKFLSFLKTFCFLPCHGPPTSSSSTSSFDPATGEADLNNHHVIILEIKQRAVMKAKNQTMSTFMIMTEEELQRLIKAKKSDFADCSEKKIGFFEGDGENEEEFFSVKSCFSRSSNGEEEYLLTLSEDWFGECEGWPFGLWRRRQMVVVLPPLPKSPADSWIWHKRNLCNGKV